MQPFLTAHHSDTSDLARCHKGLLKYKLIYSTHEYYVLVKGSTGHLEEGRGTNVACGPHNLHHCIKGCQRYNCSLLWIQQSRLPHTKAAVIYIEIRI